MISQGPVVVSAGKTKYSPTVGRDVESNARWMVGSEAGDVGQRQRALRLVERRALGIALEQLDDVAFAAGDDHKIAAARIVFQICDRRRRE